MSLTKNKTSWNASEISKEQNSGEVLTKPNQGQSIREILFRNTQGMAYDNYKTPYYEDQATWSSKSLNVIQDMEATEKMAFLTELNKETTALKNKIKSFENEKAELIKAKQAEVNAEPNPAPEKSE